VRQERSLLIGSARTSTIEQVNGLDAQIDQLNALGCEKIFSEQVSSISKRLELIESVGYRHVNTTAMQKHTTSPCIRQQQLRHPESSAKTGNTTKRLAG
jgi:hypothetical protein